MENFGAFLDEDWESLSKLFSVEDYSQNLLPYTSHPDQSLSFDSATPNTDYFQCVSQENSIEETSNALFTNQANVISNEFHSLDFHMMDVINGYSATTLPVFADDMMEEIHKLNADLCSDQLSVPQILQQENNDQMQLKRKYEAQPEDKSSSESLRKKPRAPKDNVCKNKRTPTQSRKNKKGVQISNYNAEDNNEICSSENDSNDSQEVNEGSASESKAKTTKGSATDQQSLYARKRREKINERLKILQNLVPNGTKVDISTMLEEAVQYVKFLQVQIKLLSSDDLWMYAPIAYNGMDMGFYQKMMLPNLRHLGLDSV